ncbi:MAG: hypothetical protein WBB04_10990 [Candidatus Macondimonas sp.]|jgi:hypothetical protein
MKLPQWNVIHGAIIEQLPAWRRTSLSRGESLAKAGKASAESGRSGLPLDDDAISRNERAQSINRNNNFRAMGPTRPFPPMANRPVGFMDGVGGIAEED